VKRNEIPDFGVMRGINVVCTGAAYAGPAAATLMGEIGANVIHVENVAGDMARSIPSGWALEHRNQRCMSLNLQSEGGRDVFHRLIAMADIWIESSKGGTYSNWGLTDEFVWTINPKLVIVHVSGFGQTGVPGYVRRPGFDGIAQAFSGFMFWNGESPSSPPQRVKPFIADFVPPLYAAFAALAALNNANRTGRGESIDVAQYEVMVRLQNLYLQDALNGGRVAQRTGNQEEAWGVYDSFRCKDGRDLLIMINGPAMWERALPLLGLADDPDFHRSIVMAFRSEPAAEKADRAVARFCAERSCGDAERELIEAGIACSRIFSPDDMLDDPHYRARETLTSWHDEIRGQSVRGPNIVPKYKLNPTRIWSSGPAFNRDTVDILGELGFDTDEREALFAASACSRPGDQGKPQ